MNCVPLTSESPSLACSRTGSSPARGERVGAGEELALEPGAPLADQRKRKVRERREVAARPDRAAARDLGHDPARETFEEQLDHLDARPGVPLRERVRAHEHRGLTISRGYSSPTPQAWLRSSRSWSSSASSSGIRVETKRPKPVVTP